jgi:hypothetical protein
MVLWCSRASQAARGARTLKGGRFDAGKATGICRGCAFHPDPVWSEPLRRSPHWPIRREVHRPDAALCPEGTMPRRMAGIWGISRRSASEFRAWLLPGPPHGSRLRWTVPPRRRRPDGFVCMRHERLGDAGAFGSGIGCPVAPTARQGRDAGFTIARLTGAQPGPRLSARWLYAAASVRAGSMGRSFAWGRGWGISGVGRPLTRLR